MDRVHANPADVWKPGSFPMNQAVAEPSGRRVHLTGQVAWDADGNVVGVGDVERQTDVALENIAKILKDLGGEMSDIVSLTTYFVRDEDKDAISRARMRVFRKDTGPAATGVRVAGLWEPELLVELTVVAVIPEERFQVAGYE
jgi:enamine deaminase RidA (YjgF/YER057c/UK114 family)